jgi:hypothetical protein
VRVASGRPTRRASVGSQAFDLAEAIRDALRGGRAPREGLCVLQEERHEALDGNGAERSDALFPAQCVRSFAMLHH